MNISTEHILQCNQSEPLARRIVNLMHENDFVHMCIHDELSKSVVCVITSIMSVPLTISHICMYSHTFCIYGMHVSNKHPGLTLMVTVSCP